MTTWTDWLGQKCHGKYGRIYEYAWIGSNCSMFGPRPCRRGDAVTAAGKRAGRLESSASNGFLAGSLGHSGASPIHPWRRLGWPHGIRGAGGQGGRMQWRDSHPARRQLPCRPAPPSIDGVGPDPGLAAVVLARGAGPIATTRRDRSVIRSRPQAQHRPMKGLRRPRRPQGQPRRSEEIMDRPVE